MKFSQQCSIICKDHLHSNSSFSYKEQLIYASQKQKLIREFILPQLIKSNKFELQQISLCYAPKEKFITKQSTPDNSQVQVQRIHGLKSFLHFGLFDEDDQDFNGQAPEKRGVGLEGEDVAEDALLHAFELLLEADIGGESKEDDELLPRLDLQDIGVDLEQEGVLPVGNGVVDQQSWLQLQRVVLLVVEHHPSLVRHRLVYDDPDDALPRPRALQHLLAEDARQLDLVEEPDRARVFAFRDDQLAAAGGALGDFFRVGGDDDVGRGAGLHHDAHFVLAVVGAFAQQEKAGVDCAGGKLEVEKGDGGTLEGQRDLPVLPGQDRAQVELAGQFQQ